MDGCNYYQKPLMTETELGFFETLMKALPNNYIFPQVSFGALLRGKDYATFCKFSQKMADYVICNHKLKVLAIVELDDHTHDKKKAKDQARNEMLQEAGYFILRFDIRDHPTVQVIQKQFIEVIRAAAKESVKS